MPCTKPIPDFENDSSLTEERKYRRRYYYATRELRIAQTAAWQKANPERTRIAKARSKDKNRERMKPTNREYARRRRLADPLYARAHYWSNRDDILEATRHKKQRIKEEVLSAYGGACACCGEIAFEFLCLDHINEDGHIDRKEGMGGGGMFYGKLKRAGFPKGRLQVPCHNGNAAKAYYGYCPHKRDAALMMGLKPQDIRPVVRQKRKASPFLLEQTG